MVPLPKEIEQYLEEMAANFKRGTTEMLLLALLKDGDQYAYELSKALKKKSKGLFDIQGPTLYTALYRLQSHGFVSTREEQAGRRIRVYYHLLPSGEEYLRRVWAVYQSVGAGVRSVMVETDLSEQEEDAT